MPLRDRRVNDPAEPDDGLRVLVTRYRPRGVGKEDETWDVWCPHLAPSVPLLRAFQGKDGPPLPFAAYADRYTEEMRPQGYWLDGLTDRLRRGETVTLLCSSACRDRERCHRSVLAAILARRLAPKPDDVGPKRRAKR